MIWIYRFFAAALLIAAAAHAWTESRLLLQPRLGGAQRLAAALPASAAPQVAPVGERTYRLLVRGCRRPLTIAVVPPSFTPRAAVLNLQAPGDHLFYAYLDWFGSTPDRIAVFERRLSRPLLSSLGLSEYTRLREMLVIAEPAGCNIASATRWERYWRAHGRGEDAAGAGSAP